MPRMWFLEDVNVFGLLCPHKFKRHTKEHTFTNYSKEDFIYFKDDAANKVYLIRQGKVKLGYYSEDGKEIIRAILTKGELFGEKAILGEDTRSEFAQSIDPKTVVCPISVTAMQDLMRDNHPFSLRIYKLLGLRLRKLERRLDLLLFKDVTTRLKEFLYEMADDFGYCCPNTGDTVIKHPYTQRDIASLIGTSRPTLNTLMNELRAANFLDFSRKEIRLKVA